MPSPSPAAVLVSNGTIAPHAPPSAAAFLDSTPGAYTTARGTLLWWPRHLRRLAESAALLARSHPHLLGLPLPRSRALDLDFLSIQSLVNPSVRVAIHEMRTRLPVTKDEHLALTALVRGAGAGAGADSISGSWDGLDVFVHVGTYAPPVFGESGARLAVAGRGRDAAAAKYASWARSVLYSTEENERNGQFSNQTMATKFEVQTAPLSDGVLPGIICQIVIEVCHDIGIPVREISPSWSNNEFWKEAFVTSSLRLIQHVESVQVPLFWEDIQSKTWSDVPWAVKKFQVLDALRHKFRHFGCCALFVGYQNRPHLGEAEEEGIWWIALESGWGLHSLASPERPIPAAGLLQAAMDEWVHQAESWIRQQPPEQIYIAAAVVALTVLLLIVASCLKSSKPNTIVLSGLSGSGKTTIFYQLQDGSSHQGTVTSMEENNDTFVLHSEQERKGKVKPVHVVDVPGHSRLKPKLDEVLPKAAGVVFVVDAQDFFSSMQAAAEYLYDILTKATVVKKKVPVLIFCNKTDKVTAHSKEFIKKQLEKEINKLLESRNAISSADISDEVQLGVPGEAFNFSQCQNKVAVAEGAGMTGNVSAVEQFIREHVKA
ncbi:unnamed protein product [Miscanthus lutarioriparius]|uniref:Signal recognition particle receptor subunit beta n=1 Tax=Miscanthus lutarioriparius TaxID=422564 RepID=A0A811SKP0_9POAL|nr:unnamed protein product [Miscanthus lutarioriparius]